MQNELKEIDYLKKLALNNVWIPSRSWSVLTAPRGFTIFTDGKGCEITDINGKTYLDYWGAINGVNLVGYGRMEIANAAYGQLSKLQIPPVHELTIPKIKLAKKLADLTPGSLSKVFFANGGTESIETALKIARKYQRILGYNNRYKVIGTYTYHGSTFGAMSAGWVEPFTWEDFEPLVPGFLHVVHPWCSRCELGLEYSSCKIQCAKQIEELIRNELPETVAAFMGLVDRST